MYVCMCIFKLSTLIFIDKILSVINYDNKLTGRKYAQVFLLYVVITVIIIMIFFAVKKKMICTFYLNNSMHKYIIWWNKNVIKLIFLIAILSDMYSSNEWLPAFSFSPTFLLPVYIYICIHIWMATKYGNFLLTFFMGTGILDILVAHLPSQLSVQLLAAFWNNRIYRFIHTYTRTYLLFEKI